MLLRDKSTGDLILVEDLERLASPFDESISGRNQAGQEEQDPQRFAKSDLEFPSGESLPRCWLDSQFVHDEEASVTRDS